MLGLLYFQPILITKSESSLNKPSKRPKSQRHLPHLQPIQKCAQISFQNALTGSWRSYGGLVRLGAPSQTILHVALYLGTFLFWISGQIKWSELSYNLLATVVGFISADANNRVAAPYMSRYYTVVRNFSNCWPIFKILLPGDLAADLQKSHHVFRHIINVSLHYLVNICHLFDSHWSIARFRSTL